MAKRGARGVDATPTGFFQFFSGIGRAFLQTKFLAVGSSVHEKFSDRTYRLDSKIRQREDAGGWQLPPPRLSKS